MKTAPWSFYRYIPVSTRDEKWGLFATTAGETRIAPHAAYPPSGHPKSFAFDWRHGRVLESYALVYISEGRGKFETKPRFSAELEAGHAFLLFPGVWHRYSPDPQTGWHEHWIGFDGDLARRWQAHGFISPKSPVLRMRAEDTILATFHRVMEALRAHRPAAQQILAGAAAYLLGLFYSAQQSPPAVQDQSRDLVEKAISRIQNDYTRPLDMAALARELGLSYSRFRTIFTRHTGFSPHQYLLQLRIASARNLLMETKLSIKEIALQTGFEDEHYFSRLFRQKMNSTPSQWRRRGLSAHE